MPRITRALVALFVASCVLASPAEGHIHTNHSAPRTCSRTYTAPMFRRAAITAYAGTRTPSHLDRSHLWRFLICSRIKANQPVDHRVWARSVAANAQRRSLASNPYSSAVASVYDAAGGPIACGGDSYGLGVANKTLPCGTRVEVCFNGCVIATVFDRGPYIAGRDWDLSRAVENAIGFPFGVATIRYRLLR